MNIPELIEQHVAALEARIEHLKVEFARENSGRLEAESRALTYKKERDERQQWLDKISKALQTSNLVRGDFEASVKALIDDSKRLEAMSLSTAQSPAKLVDELRQQMFDTRSERDQARDLLLERRRIDARIEQYLLNTENQDGEEW